MRRLTTWCGSLLKTCFSEPGSSLPPASVTSQPPQLSLASPQHGNLLSVSFFYSPWRSFTFSHIYVSGKDHKINEIQRNFKIENGIGCGGNLNIWYLYLNRNLDTIIWPSFTIFLVLCLGGFVFFKKTLLSIGESFWSVSWAIGCAYLSSLSLHLTLGSPGDLNLRLFSERILLTSIPNERHQKVSQCAVTVSSLCQNSPYLHV